MSSDRTQINITVNPERKERWEEYVNENNEASSLSHLIRLSVEREINRDESDGQAGEVDLSGIDERFDGLESRLDDLSVEIRQLVEQEEMENVEELAGDVYEELPRVDDEEVWKERLQSGNIRQLIVDDDATEDDLMKMYEGGEDKYEAVWENYVTMADLADKLDVSEYRARRAVDRVEESFARVKTQDYEGDTYVYEVV